MQALFLRVSMSESLPPPVGPVSSPFEEALRLARFYTRLPLPALAFEREPFAVPDFDRAAFALPLIGVVVGSLGALVGALAYLAGISTTLSAILCVATMAVVTGAFHEDGLADSCDGLFGGNTVERRLEIMKDSRLGTFGAAGLVFALLIRIFALADLFRLVGPVALLLVIGVAALARPLAMLPALWLPPAASTGLARSVALPGPQRAGVAMGLGAVIALGCGWPAGLLPAVFMGIIATFITLYALSRLASAKLGGYTGDTLGAAEQVAEITLFLVLSAAANGHGPV